MNKKNLSYLLTLMMVMMMSVFMVACSDSSSDFSLVQTSTISAQDPEGTVLVNLTNDGENSISFGLSRVCMLSSNNFKVISPYASPTDEEIVSVGKVSGLSQIKNIPESGWSRSVAVVPENGYIIHYLDSNGEYKYSRIYVVSYITNTSGGIIGAIIKYQIPWNADGNLQQDYTATTTVKEAKIERVGISNGYVQPSSSCCTFYEDYNNRYSLYLIGEKLDIIHYVRKNGDWTYYTDYINSSDMGFYCCAPEGLESIDQFVEITISQLPSDYFFWKEGYTCERASTYSQFYYAHYFANYYPKGGYYCSYKTENNIGKRMCVFTKDYTLDTYGSLKDITIQYRLF